MKKQKATRVFSMILIVMLLAACGASTETAPTATTSAQDVAVTATDNATTNSTTTDTTIPDSSTPANSTTTPVTTVEVSEDAGATTVAEAIEENSASHDKAEDYVWDSTQETQITLNGDSIEASAASVIVAGSTATITAAGTYTLS